MVGVGFQPLFSLMNRQGGGIQALKMISGGHQGLFDAWPWMGEPRVCCSVIGRNGLWVLGWWQPWLGCETLDAKEDLGNIAQACRDDVKKVKPQLEFGVKKGCERQQEEFLLLCQRSNKEITQLLVTVDPRKEQPSLGKVAWAVSWGPFSQGSSWQPVVALGHPENNHR